MGLFKIGDYVKYSPVLDGHYVDNNIYKIINIDKSDSSYDLDYIIQLVEGYTGTLPENFNIACLEEEIELAIDYTRDKKIDKILGYKNKNS